MVHHKRADAQCEPRWPDLCPPASVMASYDHLYFLLDEHDEAAIELLLPRELIVLDAELLESPREDNISLLAAWIQSVDHHKLEAFLPVDAYSEQPFVPAERVPDECPVPTASDIIMQSLFTKRYSDRVLDYIKSASGSPAGRKEFDCYRTEAFDTLCSHGFQKRVPPAESLGFCTVEGHTSAAPGQFRAICGKSVGFSGQVFTTVSVVSVHMCYHC